MYPHGQELKEDDQFRDHAIHHVPIQVYLENKHTDIGYVEEIDSNFIQINQTLYNRSRYTFISRAGF